MGHSILVYSQYVNEIETEVIFETNQIRKVIGLVSVQSSLVSLNV